MEKKERVLLAVRIMNYCMYALISLTFILFLVSMLTTALTVGGAKSFSDTDSFVGWEALVYGPDPKMAYGQNNFGFNGSGIVLTVILLITTVVMLASWHKYRGIGRIVSGAVLFAVMIPVMYVFFGFEKQIDANATDKLLAQIELAKANGEYALSAMPVIVGVFALLTALGALGVAGLAAFTKIAGIKEPVKVRVRDDDDEDDEEYEEEATVSIDEPYGVDVEN